MVGGTKSETYTNAASLNQSYILRVLANCDPNKTYRLLFAWHPNGGNIDNSRIRDEFLKQNHCRREYDCSRRQRLRELLQPWLYPVVWCEWDGEHLSSEFARAETWKFFAQF